MHIGLMLTWLRLRTLNGRIGASLVVNYWAINSARRGRASPLQRPGTSGTLSSFSNSGDIWNGMVGQFAHRRLLGWGALISSSLARRPATQMFEDPANAARGVWADSSRRNGSGVPGPS